VGRLFGTDGVRGLANRDLTAELALDISVAAAHVLGDAGALSAKRPTAIVGRDPRASGEFLEAAVVAGLASAGVDVYRVGVLPTPAIAYLVKVRDADFGVMLSASHNAMPDNGIKLFARGGAKLDDAVEDAIEEHIGEHWDRPLGAGVGRIHDDMNALSEYIDHLVATVGGDSDLLTGLSVVVDCAHGAASFVAPLALQRLGANVTAIGADPDGLNINVECGSTHMELLQGEVVRLGADLGIAHDGDADRCLAVDSRGQIVDGDQILAILAIALNADQKLRHNTVVSTVMSNLGFARAMRDHDISVMQTAVGDRYVLEAIRAGSYSLGGEQSGHIILPDHSGTGDGVLTALHLLAHVKRSGRSLEELATVMRRYPQILINVPDVDKSRVQSSAILAHAVREAEDRLGEEGRVLLRPSGTEPLVRVMVEAPTEELAREIASELAAVVARELRTTPAPIEP
jgi:phosphoglucosamine mutase